jgi:hypothetical protein
MKSAIKMILKCHGTKTPSNAKHLSTRFGAVPNLKFHSNNCAYHPQIALKCSSTHYMWDLQVTRRESTLGVLIKPKSKVLVMLWIFEIGASFKFEFAASEKNEYKMQS